MDKPDEIAQLYEMLRDIYFDFYGERIENCGIDCANCKHTTTDYYRAPCLDCRRNARLQKPDLYEEGAGRDG